MKIHLTWLCVVLWLAGQARAQDPDDGRDDRYRALIQEAVAEFGARHWEEARALFTEAHRIYPNARTLRGLGMAAFELRNYVEAHQTLTQALASQVQPLTPALREKTRSLLERANGFIGVYTVQGPPDMVIRVDGRPANYDPEGRVLLNSGKHVVEAVLPGAVSQQRYVDVRGGEEDALEFETQAPPQPLEPPATGPPPAQEAAASAAAGSEPAEAQASSRGALPWVLMASGAALGGAALVTGLLATGALDEVEDGCEDRSMCPAELEDDANRAQTLAVATDVLWVGGAVSMVAGLSWLLIAGGDASSDPGQVALAVDAGPAGLRVRGGF